MDKKSKDALKIKLSGILPELNERQRRILLAAEAASVGYGGIRTLSGISGVAESTIRRGVNELRKKPAVPAENSFLTDSSTNGLMATRVHFHQF